MRARRHTRPVLAALALACGLAMMAASVTPARAQTPGQPPSLRTPVLVIDFDELYQVSALGQRIQQELDERSRALAEEIARIDAEMAAEEKALTERRSELSPEEFRALADAFDEKVQRLRREQDENAQQLNRIGNEERLRFRQSALPVLGQLMLETGAVMVMETRYVLIFNDAIDVTELTAARIDARLSETQNAPPVEDAPQDPVEETNP